MQDDQELTDLDAHVEGEHALPQIRCVEFQYLPQDDGETESVEHPEQRRHQRRHAVSDRGQHNSSGVDNRQGFGIEVVNHLAVFDSVRRLEGAGARVPPAVSGPRLSATR